MTIIAIILTTPQANELRGTYNQIAALEPVPTNDGRFFLPLAVLDDQNFASIHEHLTTLPIEEITIETNNFETE